MGQHPADSTPGKAESPPGTDERYLVPALIRGLRALQAFSAERPRLTLGELAAALGVTRSAVYRLAYTLEQLGFLTHDQHSRTYTLGPAVLRLGYGYLASRDLVGVATPFLEALRDRTGWSAHLGVLEGTDVVYLARQPTRRSLASMVQVGTRLPAHATAMGRVLLAAMPEQEVHRLYAGAKLTAFSEWTATTMRALQGQLRIDAANGFVTQFATFEAGVASAAAPVRDVTGHVVAAINISAVALLASEAELRGPLKDEVVATAAQISRTLGFAATSTPSEMQQPG